MPLEKRLVYRNIFYCAQKTTFFKIQHAVYQQERVTVRQKFQNLFNVQSMSVSSQNTLPV
ncbi:hypothetical Protein UUU_06450 [Klebsiella pneumoniae subsp. pneumoniae DSM 30104 = JCM 1662 = NBRC 14940]|nr:hypothetical Protein UUU_06450 [Klebsiella pneumoniae subsp. pneumoniae DSM 30104 = JCM 1662 = NBRC 14940]